MEAAELERLQSEIERVGREINAAEAKLQQVDSTDADGLKYWRTEKEQLRREKEQLRAEKQTILQRFMETTSRVTTPGAAEAVFCIVSLVKQSRECRAFPRGTGFAISPKHIFTAWHNCLFDEDSSDMLPTISAVREISPRKGLVESEIVSLNLVASDADEDWAVFARREGDFATHVRICTEEGLPAVRDVIGIKDYPVGLVDSFSAAKLSVLSVLAKVSMYECRLQPRPASMTGDTSFSVPVVKSALRTIDTDEVVIMVSGGRVKGSCGAPYFNLRGEVVAFHFESVDDSESETSAHSSHVSYSHGYVLCRLARFMSFYNECIPSV